MYPKFSLQLKTVLLLLIQFALYSSQTLAMELDWNGNYRIEYVEIDKTEMNSGSRKGYLLNNLVLMPHIIPSDDVEVISKIHLAQDSLSAYPNSQAGMIWGNSHNFGNSSYLDDSNAFSNNRPKTGVAISQLYLKLNQEWGSLIVGRAPVHFGLGITHNSGKDPFSHWYDTRDIIAYKMHVGNLAIIPSISKQYAGDYQLGNEITNQTFEFEYKNRETGDWLGLFYETRKGNSNTNDTPVSQLNGTAVNSSLSITAYNIVLGKDFTDFNFRVEGGFQSGSTGVVDALNRDIRVNSYAVVAEFNIFSNESRNLWNIKAGTVSGDNPDTEDFEGYLIDRNYDIAFLLFNHPLGQSADIFKTSFGRNPAISSNRNTLDDEYISNVLFFAPQWTRILADRWKMRNTLIVAQLNNAQMKIGSTTEKINGNVGFEWDLGFSYKANENMEWKFDTGFLFPGKTFEKGSANLNTTSTVIGIGTSAAITF